MDVREIRRENILKLIGNNSQRAWAESAGMLPTQVNQILKRKRNVGYKLARKIEVKLGLEDCSLDKSDSAKSSTVDPAVLATIIFDVQTAMELVGLEWPTEQSAKLVANLYTLYQETGELPDVQTAVRLQAIQG